MAGTGGSDFSGFNPKGPRWKGEMRLGGQLAGSRYSTCGLDQTGPDQQPVGGLAAR